MLCKKRKFPFSFFTLLTQWHEFPAPKLTKIDTQNWQSLFLWMWHYFQRVLIWLHILKWIIEQVAVDGFWKSPDVSRTIAATRMELFVALVSSFQPPSNFTKNPYISPIGVPNTPLQYYNVFWNLCRWWN